MNFVITGSLGHISAPLAQQLVARGDKITVVSSDAGKARAIEAIGAKPAIGTLNDKQFLADTFKGADAVYAMIPPPHGASDPLAYCQSIAENYAYAVERAGVKHVVYLSSIGAHAREGVGIIRMHHEAEKVMAKTPGASIAFMRPMGFYYNLLGFIPAIKATGAIASNYGAEDIIPWVSPLDIADAVAAALPAGSAAAGVRYIASDSLSCRETAKLLGQAIGKPDLQWNLISDQALESILLKAGMPKAFASGLVEMQASMHSGVFYEDFYRHKPAFGKVKMRDYAQDFAAAYARG